MWFSKVTHIKILKVFSSDPFILTTFVKLMQSTADKGHLTGQGMKLGSNLKAKQHVFNFTGSTIQSILENGNKL